MDPFEVLRIYIEQGEESPVNVVLKFDNCTIHGLSEIEIYKIKWVHFELFFVELNSYKLNDLLILKTRGFDKNIEKRYEIRYKGPELSFIGPYSLHGQILILPIQGIGISNLTLSK